MPSARKNPFAPELHKGHILLISMGNGLISMVHVLISMGNGLISMVHVLISMKTSVDQNGNALISTHGVAGVR